MLKKLLKQGACLTLGVMLLLTGCGSKIPESEQASAGGAGVSVDEPDGSDAVSGKLTVSYIDVGQGDSTLIQLPDGKTILIDAGEVEYGRTVSDYIESLGIKKLDYVIATHPHSDHIGGLPDVISQFDVGAVYMPKAQNNTKIFEKLLTGIQDKGLKINTAKAGVTLLSEDGLEAEFLAPNGTSYSDLNNYSAVLRLSFGSNSFLFTGDAEAKSEGEILSAYGSGQLQSDVLKVGHHGSAYSSSDAFLKAVSPKYAVISCGAGNKYGHPESVILDKLSGAKVSVYRTDEAGTIVFTSDGSKLTVDKKASPVKENAPPAGGSGAAALGASDSASQGSSGQGDSSSQANGNGGSASGQSSPTQQQSQTGNGQASSDTVQSSGQSQASQGGQSDTSQTPPAQQPEQPAQATQTETTVYVTKTGSKYHRDGCQYLRQSKIAISLDEAKASYEPCSKCSPPQ